MQEQFIYFGVVESRNDPLGLDRIQVRVFGVHTESLDDIPVADLPWAISIGPSTSAGISGVGHSGTGYVEGTSVIVVFADGPSKQQPIILGSYHGVPLAKSPFSGPVLADGTTPSTTTQTPSTPPSSPSTGGLEASGTPVTDSSGQPVQVASDGSYQQKLKDALGKSESGNNYNALEKRNGNYIGKYQMGAGMLIDLGYVKKGTPNNQVRNPASWTGKDGMNSQEDFLNSPATQEKAMDAELSMNESRLKKLGVINANSTDQEKAGYLATSHLLGTGGALKMKNGSDGADANGTTGKKYYDMGYKAVAGANPTVAPDKTTPDNPARQSNVTPTPTPAPTPAPQPYSGDFSPGYNSSVQINNTGFKDPNGVFPRYLNEQDTNRLARNQNLENTIVLIKEESEDRDVPIANGGTWDQSPTPYNAKYPFNHVFESESGHVIEIDDTPNNERLNFHHRTGTFTEIDRNGTMVRKIVGDTYEIWERNGYVHIMGSVNITVDGSANIKVANNCELEINGDMNMNIGGDANWSIGGNLNIKTGGTEDHNNGGEFLVDAADVWLNSGKSTAGNLPTPTDNSNSDSNEFSPLLLETRGFEELAAFDGDELTPQQATARQSILKETGLTDTNPTPPVVDENMTAITSKSTVTEIPVSCGAFAAGKININGFISTNYKLKELTLGRQVSDQAGLKDVEIACNLKAVAENVVEKVKAAYPDMIITSGLREVGSNPSSQHPKGQAVDIQFKTKKSSDYLEIAKSLAGSLSFDQLILEYRSSVRKNGGQPTTWIHISYSRSGNRGQVFTMDNDKRISEFGVLKLVT